MECRAYGRSVGRSDGSDVITKPKFLALMGLPKSLSYGAPPRAPAARARASLVYTVLGNNTGKTTSSELPKGPKEYSACAWKDMRTCQPARGVS